jgi:hypothetical protein
MGAPFDVPVLVEPVAVFPVDAALRRNEPPKTI